MYIYSYKYIGNNSKMESLNYIHTLKLLANKLIELCTNIDCDFSEFQ